MEQGKCAISTLQTTDMISETVTTKISKSTCLHPCSKVLATAEVGLAHYDSFRGRGSHLR